uniref:Pyrophosphate--fructose 6-phosphate 1-phosphotransferase n=1 Tax=Arundo donax TaxID=35708 RepID=A0A0A9DE12_ARUDO
MSLRTMLPDASVAFDFCRCSCPAPSAIQTRANPLVSIKCSRCRRTPFGPSRVKGISGIRQISTWPLDREACIVMKPLLLPISLTSPMP